MLTLINQWLRAWLLNRPNSILIIAIHRSTGGLVFSRTEVSEQLWNQVPNDKVGDIIVHDLKAAEKLIA